jgi:hypothetical protein
MNSTDISRRNVIKAGTAGVFMVTAGGLLVIDDAKADLVTALGLLNAVITLLTTINSMSDKSLSQQVSGSTEVARSNGSSNNSAVGADPNMFMQTYSNGGTLPLNCQGQVSRDALLTIQNGDPYLHSRGSGNRDDSLINRWESNEFSRVAREETGTFPIPASPADTNVSNTERKMLDKKGINTEIWRPEYIRNVKISNSVQPMIVARNITTNKNEKKAILV